MGPRRMSGRLGTGEKDVLCSKLVRQYLPITVVLSTRKFKTARVGGTRQAAQADYVVWYQAR